MISIPDVITFGLTSTNDGKIYLHFHTLYTGSSPAESNIGCGLCRKMGIPWRENININTSVTDINQ